MLQGFLEKNETVTGLKQNTLIHTHLQTINMEFKPAQLSKGKVWMVTYYAQNPYSGEMQRIRIKVNRIKSIREREKYCNRLIKEINEKLYAGWNPYVDESCPKMYVLLTDALRTYERAKYKELKPNTLRSYKSMMKRFKEWLIDKCPDIYAGSFTKRNAIDFMMYLKALPGVSSKTYNNNMIFFRALFTYLEKLDYVPENYFSSIDKARDNTPKIRRPLNNDQMHKMIAYLKAYNERYLAMCMLCYYCFLRPSDIIKLRPEQFDLDAHHIYIEADKTKNGKSSVKVISEALEPYLECLRPDLDKVGGYMFTGELFKYGQYELDPRKIAKYWKNKVRANCGFGDELQFYSLKDTGMSNALTDGISPVAVQGQADHSSLKVTEKYTDKRDPEGQQQLRTKMRRFE